MRKTYLALGLPLLLPLAATSAAIPSSAEEGPEYLRLFQLPYNVKGSAVLTTDYGEGLESLNSVATYSVDRDYGTVSFDGEDREAIRDHGLASDTIHYEGSDGYSYHDTLNYQNQLESVVDKTFGKDLVYASTYYDPFDYISPSDIQGSALSSQKAELMLNAYFGIDFPVTAATFSGYDLENPVDSKVTLEFTCPIRPDAIESTSGMFIGESTLTVDLSFEILKESFGRISVGTQDNPELKSALQGLGTNYTVTIAENDIRLGYTYYYSGDSLYIHGDPSLPYPVDGDTYYVQGAGGRATGYRYSASTSSWSTIGINYQIANYLPNYSKIAPEVLQKQSEGVYAFLPDAVPLLSRDLVPSAFSVSAIEPFYAYVSLDGETMSEVSLGYYDFQYGPYSITASFSEVGSTAMPSWLDTSFAE